MVSLSNSTVRALVLVIIFFFQAEDGIRDVAVTGVQTCALPISAIRELGLFKRLQPENLYQGPNNHRMAIRSETVMDTRVFLEEPTASLQPQLKLLTKR